MTDSSKVMRPVDSRAMSSAKRSFICTSESLVAMTASAVLTRFSRSSSTSEMNMPYCGCASQAPVKPAGTVLSTINAPCSGTTQTVRPSTGLVVELTPGMASYEMGCTQYSTAAAVSAVSGTTYFCRMGAPRVSRRRSRGRSRRIRWCPHRRHRRRLRRHRHRLHRVLRRTRWARPTPPSPPLRSGHPAPWSVRVQSCHDLQLVLNPGEAEPPQLLRPGWRPLRSPAGPGASVFRARGDRVALVW